MSEHPGLGRAADWLTLAATPVFAFMALLTAAQSGGPGDLFCGAALGMPFGSMVTMYLLMSVFHAVPWLRLFSARR